MKVHKCYNKIHAEHCASVEAAKYESGDTVVTEKETCFEVKVSRAIERKLGRYGLSWRFSF